MVSDNDILLLTRLIIQNLEKEFETKHLSKNLINTIRIEKTENGVSIIIPAQIYNQYKFFKEKVIVPKGTGSYASELDINGSAFMWYPESGQKGKRKLIEPRNHIGYVDDVIKKSIDTWVSMKSKDYKVEEIKGM